VDKWLEVGQPQKKEIGLIWLEGNPLSKLHGSINERERLSYLHILRELNVYYCVSFIVSTR
jgi:hypothetical protein